MFDAVAPRYDLLNHLLSLGIDRAWRRALARALDGVTGPVIDLCSGTGDVMFSLCRRHPTMTCLGIDFSKEMVRIGKRKASASPAGDRIVFAVGDATAISVRSESAGAATFAFGIRNVSNVPGALSETYRVLRSGGRVAILEFSLPRSPFLRAGYLFYLKRILPRVGAWMSGDGRAYQYLPDSVMEFAEGEAFLALLREAGFESVSATRLSGGIATLYAGVKAPG